MGVFAAIHIVLVISCGVVLLGVFLSLGWLWTGSHVGVEWAARIFIPVWLGVSVVNLWLAVAYGKNGARQELVDLLVVFSVPAFLAVMAAWPSTSA